MVFQKSQIKRHNDELLKEHERKVSFISATVPNADTIVQQLIRFQVAIPSWALGSGGTRFGRFAGSGEPGNLKQKIEDVGLLHALTRSAGAISLHIPWDIPDDYAGIKDHAAQYGVRFDAVNSNTFQDQREQELSYKFGSLQHVDKAVRKQAIDHIIE